MGTWSDLFTKGEAIEGYKPLFIDESGTPKAIDSEGAVDDTVTPTTVVSGDIREIVTLTQGEYDALDPVVETTLYVIVSDPPL